jgi:hypothetical protein
MVGNKRIMGGQENSEDKDLPRENLADFATCLWFSLVGKFLSFISRFPKALNLTDFK